MKLKSVKNVEWKPIPLLDGIQMLFLPGTEFMEKLNGEIETFIRGKLKNNYDKMKVVFSSLSYCWRGRT